MRTTLEIDDDILEAAQALALSHRTSLGHVLSALARDALEASAVERTPEGLPVLPRRTGGKPVTMQLVNQLRDDILE